jgi:hypothetical protein
MSAGFELKGLDAFAAELTKLPDAVRAELKPVVVSKAHALQAEVQGEYAARGVAGVGDGMHVDVDSDPASLGARVVNPSPTGHLWEQGTAARYDGAGNYRGRMPAGNVLVPAAIRARAELVVELEQALERVGR